MAKRRPICILWAERILDGKNTYAEVPVKLKDGVKEILVEEGYEDLVTE